MSDHQFYSGFLTDFSDANDLKMKVTNPIAMEETIEVLNSNALRNRDNQKRDGRQPSTDVPFKFSLSDSQLRELEKEGVQGQLNDVIEYLQTKNDTEDKQFLGMETEEWMGIGEGILAGIAAKKQASYDAGNARGEALIGLSEKNREMTEQLTATVANAKLRALDNESAAQDKYTIRNINIQDDYADRKISAIDSLQNTINQALTKERRL